MLIRNLKKEAHCCKLRNGCKCMTLTTKEAKLRPIDNYRPTCDAHIKQMKEYENNAK